MRRAMEASRREDGDGLSLDAVFLDDEMQLKRALDESRAYLLLRDARPPAGERRNAQPAVQGVIVRDKTFRNVLRCDCRKMAIHL